MDACELKYNFSSAKAIIAWLAWALQQKPQQEATLTQIYFPPDLAGEIISHLTLCNISEETQQQNI